VPKKTPQIPPFQLEIGDFASGWRVCALAHTFDKAKIEYNRWYRAHHIGRGIRLRQFDGAGVGTIVPMREPRTAGALRDA
jgi:hypothetical protein